MNKSNVIEPEEREGIADPLTELLREGAQQLIQQATLLHGSSQRMPYHRVFQHRG